MQNFDEVKATHENIELQSSEQAVMLEQQEEAHRKEVETICQQHLQDKVHTVFIIARPFY